MTEFKNPQQQLQTFHLRVTAAALFVLICFSLLAVRFVYLQVFRHNQYALQADENRVSLAPIVPNRGVIMDRNGVVLARNYSAYTLEITPSKIGRPLEDVITDLSDVVEITPRDRARFKKLMDDSKSFESLPIRTRLTDEEVARFTAQRFRFPGVDVHARLFRQYPLGETAAHVIGYIGRISQRDRQRIEAMSEENDSDSAKYDIRPGNPRLKTANFSGGNQQKIVLAREIEQDPGVLIVGQPTRGVDVGAIEFIHKRLIAMRDQGKAVLVVSVELDEIRSLCDRILVMFAGRIVGERGPDATEGELGLLMAGVEQQEAAQ